MRVRTITVASIALLLAAWSGAALAQANKTTIRFAYQTAIAGGPLMVTDARGLWSVPVQARGFVDGADILQAVLAGSADAGLIATAPAITGAQTGDYVIAAVAGRAGDTTAIVVPPDSGIKSVADLKGKTLAIQEGTTTALDIRNFVLPHAGLAPGDTKLVNMNMGDMPAALAGGRVNSIASVEPYISIAIQQKIGVRLQSLMAFDPIPEFLVFRTAFVAQHPDVVIGALRSYYKGVEWIKAHPDETVNDIVAGLAKQGINLDKQVVAMAWKTMDLDIQFSEPDMRAYLNRTAGLLQKSGKLKQIPDWNKVLRLDLARKAMAK